MAGVLGGIQAKIPVSPPDDRLEQEADEAAIGVVSGRKVARISCIAAGGGVSSPVSRQAPEEEQSLPTQPEDQKEEKETPVRTVPLQRQGSEGAVEDAGTEARIKAPGTGRSLPDGVRAEMEAGLGADFSGVRIHDTAEDRTTAGGLKAKAFAYRNHIWMGHGASVGDRKLMAHELTHVVQQQGPGGRVQRYEAGEHGELGETQAELKAAFAPSDYKVRKGDRLSAIARKFGISVTELKGANKAKLKKWPAANGSGRMIEGFNAGETISIPQKLSNFAKAAIKDKSAKFTVNGVVMDYGVGIAMGDLYESPGQMAKASPKELKALAVLIKREQSGGTPVTTVEWEKATSGRYLKLAEKNEAHFAPPSAGLVTPSPAGAASSNHKTEWRKHHKAAVDVSKSGNKDRALMTNAYGDHFLTDAFSAGHLINKRDVMEKFKGQLQLDAKGKEFTASSKKFFAAVATDAFTGNVQSEFSKYETYKAYKWGWNPNINSVSRFSTLLQGIHKEEPDLLANAVAKGVHDQLNTVPGGLPVENPKGDSWNLSGDGTLNAKTKEIARKAVAQSQLNVIAVYKTTSALKYFNLYKKVWDFTPRPSIAGIKRVASELSKGADIKSKGLRKAVVTLIKNNYKLLINELVKRKKLKKA